ncbi:MAG: alpha-glucan family phosphorylase [Micromonosporaceae bacterium]|nr:alpha-glucan family phosphorylase [Micromonosporaceae bacterium]
MRALRQFTVRAALPEPLAPLGELVANLRWSWHPETRDVFAAVDRELWERVGGDPMRLLSEVPPRRLDELARDEAFLDAMRAAHRDLTDYLAGPRWYSTLGDDAPGSIAYFSPEYGITSVMPQYSGGLGILAGDHLKSASDLGAPVVGVGLLYRGGYFAQSLTADGWQQERYPSLDPHGMPLTLLSGADGEPALVEVGLPEGRTLRAQIWQAQVGRVPLLLLDSDIEANEPAERDVTDRLYGGGVERRMTQEVLLGVGGVRALRLWSQAVGAPTPEVYHTNEGHAGFLGLERIAELMDAGGLDFDAAHQAVRAGTVFTTHTPVPAGIDRFPREEVGRLLHAACSTLPVERVLELGAEADPNVFNMAHMGLRLAQRCNGVSRLHGHVSREMFASLWPGFEVDEAPITSITNGVHAPSWLGRPAFDLAVREEIDLVTAAGQEPLPLLDPLTDREVWSLRRQLREQLIVEARRRLRESWRDRGAAAAELRWIDDALDPEVLTIGFARRVPSYKRLTLMLADRERLARLLLDPERPVQLVIAGKAHPADDGGKKLIQEIVGFSDDPQVRRRVMFLPDYDMALGQALVAGCDVWLNNPLRPLEACGTSGMKAALNGCLNVSVRDGWWDELYDGANGWAIPTADGVPDPARRDALEATALYELIESSVTPLFYDRDLDDVPARWVALIRRAVRSLGSKVLATRMVRDYVQRLYLPAAAASQRMRETGEDGAPYQPARALAAWRAKVIGAWDQVRVARVDSDGVGDAPQLGAELRVRADVVLGDVSPDEVEVQACAGRPVTGDGGRDPDVLTDVSTRPMAHTGSADGVCSFEARVPLERAGAFGYTVRVVPRHELLASPTDLGLVAYP